MDKLSEALVLTVIMHYLIYRYWDKLKDIFISGYDWIKDLIFRD